MRGLMTEEIEQIFTEAVNEVSRIIRILASVSLGVLL